VKVGIHKGRKDLKGVFVQWILIEAMVRRVVCHQKSQRGRNPVPKKKKQRRRRSKEEEEAKKKKE